MSETSQGPGWWQASDGRWYSPEQHPNYGPPPGQFAPPGGYYGGPPQPVGGTNGLAVASLVLGILWGFGFLSALALVLGLVALGQIKRQQQSGRGLAIAGVVLGALGVAVMAVSIVAVFVSGGLDLDYDKACRSDTRTLRIAEEAAIAQHGEYLTELDLVSARFLAEPSALHNVNLRPDGRFVLIVTDSRCGTIGHTVGQTSNDL